MTVSAPVVQEAVLPWYRYSTEVVLRPFAGELTLLDSREGQSNGQTGDQQQRSSGSAYDSRSHQDEYNPF